MYKNLKSFYFGPDTILEASEHQWSRQSSYLHGYSLVGGTNNRLNKSLGQLVLRSWREQHDERSGNTSGGLLFWGGRISWKYLGTWYIILLLLSHFSHVWLCATPETAAHQAPPIPGILQARTMEWVAISFSNAWKWKVKVKSLSRVQLLATPWTAAYQAPPSTGFSRQEYWSRLPLPSPKWETTHI